MSRIGKKPIDVPKGVDITISGSAVTVKGPKGTLSLDVPVALTATLEGSQVTLAPSVATVQSKAFWGLYRMLIENMVVGVSQGFRKTLDIVGVGFKAESVGKNVKVVVGYSHPVTINAPDGILLKIETPTRIAVEGIDKQLVGQVAAEIRSIRPPEPYKGKGIMYTGEKVRRKAGKAAVK